jgi:uncharacterized surface protein with fasciclin (FAS1) repeats
MLRTRLLTATAAVALFAAPAAFAQDMTAPQTAPTPATAAPVPAPTPMPDAAPAPAPAEATAPTTAAPSAAETQTAAAAPAASDTIIDELKANGQFTTLLAALDKAQLTDTLKSQPAISIFAPTDAAFAQLPEAERTRLMDPANVNELRQLLLYHVVVADVNSSQIKGTKGGVETAARTQVQLDGTGDAIKVDDATVTTADIDASNGAIFAIDKVLNPATSEVASGDADEAPAAPAATEAPAAEAPATTPPAADATVTPPADETTDEAPAVAPPATEPMMTPPVATPAPTTAAPAPTPPVAPTPSEDTDPTATKAIPTPAPAPTPTPQS